MRSRRSLALSLIGLAALALFAHKVSLALGNPFFGGDAGHRVQYAWAPVAPLASRIWLPFLQLHIFAVYHAHLPAAILTLIPCVYFGLAVLCLGLVSARCTGWTGGGLVFTLLLMAGFAYQEVVPPASVQLYQEILGSFFFFFLLHQGALELRKSKVLLVAVWAALITRETFWIYLLVVTVLHAGRILDDRALRRAFLSCWAVPLLWLLSIPLFYLVLHQRLPVFPTEWPLTINKQEGLAVSSLTSSARHLAASLVDSRAVVPALAAALALAVLGLGARVRASAWLGACALFRRGPGRGIGRLPGFVPFSLLSLILVYGLILLFDPWQATSGSPRMAFTLLEHACVWMVLLYRASRRAPRARRFLARALLVIGVAFSVNRNADTWIPGDHADARRCHAELRALVDARASERPGPVTVGFVGESYWLAVRRFVAPTLHARRLYFGNEPDPGARPDLLILRADIPYRPDAPYQKHGACVLEGQRYEVWVRPSTRPEQARAHREVPTVESKGASRLVPACPELVEGSLSREACRGASRRSS